MSSLTAPYFRHRISGTRQEAEAQRERQPDRPPQLHFTHPDLLPHLRFTSQCTTSLSRTFVLIIMNTRHLSQEVSPVNSGCSRGGGQSKTTSRGCMARGPCAFQINLPGYNATPINKTHPQVLEGRRCNNALPRQSPKLEKPPAAPRANPYRPALESHRPRSVDFAATCCSNRRLASARAARLDRPEHRPPTQ